MTLDPASITSPAREATIVSSVFGVNSPRNCLYTNTSTNAPTNSRTTPSTYSHARRFFLVTSVGTAATP
ncbi:Uncharacterised protein [Mycobacterium tuberculosis]|uniref:Uncharacterized protein n=1 Tax=Mycobacterium tuberculosis TaxID=1773 RepID=A0A916L879_MYCTX|nr:Uncharacterised protein [Mycobacterium tuberculosis]COX05876.1 Uncharacterised protein [Mycobacterium tuberculosis]COX13806.1 Uncharacterised protein [Mycobacterium tuberculosis]